VSLLQLDLAHLEDVIATKAEAAEAAARPAAQAAAQVLYDEVKRNVAAIPKKTGNLDRSIYQVFSTSLSSPGVATYHISWNHRKAPHGHLVEFGHIQRYVSYIGSDGNYYTAVRASMRGKPKPSRRASQQVKDAYYVPLPGPKQVAGHAFVRNATVKGPEAADAAQKVMIEKIKDA